MNLKYCKVLSFLIIFLLSFLSHFMYDWFPCTFISFFFPVNESIWEHMKILYTSILIGGIFEYFILKIFKIPIHNFILQLFVSSYFSIILYLAIYLPIYHIWGEHLIVSILLMALVYGFVLFLSYRFMIRSTFFVLDKLSILFLIWGYIIFIIFTYRPCHVPLFYDTLHHGYGIISEKDS